MPIFYGKALNIQSIPALEGLRKMFVQSARCVQCSDNEEHTDRLSEIDDGASAVFDHSSSITVYHLHNVQGEARFTIIQKFYSRLSMKLAAVIQIIAESLISRRFCQHWNGIWPKASSWEPMQMPLLNRLIAKIKKFLALYHVLLEATMSIYSGNPTIRNSQRANHSSGQH